MCGRRAAVQFGAAQGGSAAGPTVRRFLSACEGCWAAHAPGIDTSGNFYYDVVDWRSKMPRHFLGEFEKAVLLALIRLGDNAYGVTIREELTTRLARHVAIGAVYT